MSSAIRRWYHALSLALLCSPLLTGCSVLQVNRFGTPTSVDPLPTSTLPFQVGYELLGVGSGEACGSTQEAQMATIVSRSSDSAGVGNPLLFQEAKYKAIESIPNADNLLYMRSKLEITGDKQCITVTGRGYRLVRLETGSGAAVAKPGQGVTP